MPLLVNDQETSLQHHRTTKEFIICQTTFFFCCSQTSGHNRLNKLLRPLSKKIQNTLALCSKISAKDRRSTLHDKQDYNLYKFYMKKNIVYVTFYDAYFLFFFLLVYFPQPIIVLLLFHAIYTADVQVYMQLVAVSLLVSPQFPRR